MVRNYPSMEITLVKVIYLAVVKEGTKPVAPSDLKWAQGRGVQQQNLATLFARAGTLETTAGEV